MIARLHILIGTLLLALTACGDDGNGNDDTLFTGLSGLLIAAVVIWLIVRAVRKRS